VTEPGPRILVLGYGNHGRGDDALGPLAAEAIDALALPGVSVQVAHQLQVEDALTLSEHDAAVLVDADLGGPAPFALRPVVPASDAGLLSHSVSPATVLALARGLYGTTSPAWLVGIRGYDFGAFDRPLSPGARANLEAALAALEPLLRRRDLAAFPAADADATAPAARP
jgi:hydrogenase maturation protease